MEYNFKDLIDRIKGGGSRPFSGTETEMANPFAGYDAPPKDQVYTVDEDKRVEEYGGEQKVVQDVNHAQCPSCGAAMTYEPNTHLLSCSFCGTKREIVAGNAVERSLQLGYDTAVKWRDETRVFRCANCGAESVFAKTEFATVCPFCGSSSVTHIEDLEGVRPNAVIPFGLDEAAAQATYKKFVKSRAFAPGAFKKQKRVTLKGIYVPCWTFDSRTVSSYSGVVGDYYTVTVGSGKNRRTETRVRYRRVGGNFARNFDDWLVHAGGQVDSKLFYEMNFTTQKALAYHEGFLAGYTAEHYVVGLTDGWKSAQTGMRQKIYNEIKASLHCDVVQSLDVNTGFSSNTFKYVLVPTYLFHTAYKNKNYKLIANGVTGKITGKYPVSAPKVTGLVFGILAVIAAIVACVLLL